EIFGPEAFAVVGPHAEAALAGRRSTFEAEIRWPALGPRWVHGEYVPHVDEGGRVLGYFALTHDVTSRKRAEEALREREAEFRAIFELAGSGKAQIDPATGLHLLVNQKLCELFGYSQEEIAG